MHEHHRSSRCITDADVPHIYDIGDVCGPDASARGPTAAKVAAEVIGGHKVEFDALTEDAIRLCATFPHPAGATASDEPTIRGGLRWSWLHWWNNVSNKAL